MIIYLPPKKTILLCVFFMLFSTLPEYFRVGGYPVYEYVVVIMFLIVALMGISISKLRYYMKLMLPMLILQTFLSIIDHEPTTYINQILVFYIAILIVLNCNNSPETISTICKVICFCCIIYFVFALIEWKSRFNIFSLIENVDLGSIGSASMERNGQYRIEGSYGTAIGLAIVMNFVNIISYFQAEFETNRVKRHIWLLSYVFSVVIIFLTGSRMPLITLVIAQVVMVAADRNVNKKVAIILVVVLFLLFDTLTGRVVIGEIYHYWKLIVAIIRNDHSSIDTTSSYRLNLAPALLPYIRQKMWFGQGIKSDIVFQIGGFNHTSIDNGYLASLFGHGIVGLILLVVPIIYGIVLSIRIMKKNRMGVAFLLCFFTYAINLASVAQMAEQRFVHLILGMCFALDYYYYNCNLAENTVSNAEGN